MFDKPTPPHKQVTDERKGKREEERDEEEKGYAGPVN
jgi:hypothetical protein